MVHRIPTLAIAVLVLLALVNVYSGCSRSPTSPTSPDRTLSWNSSALLQEQGYGCSVEISGPNKVCVDCDGKKNPVIILTAKGTPPGGTYQWKAEPPGRVELKQGQDFKERASVEGVTASQDKDDVTITVTYTAPSVAQPCSDTHKLTVVKPKKLEVVADHHFKVEDGTIKPPPGSLQKYMPPTKKGDVGSILIRFYKVLDQFDELWNCDGELTEEITPPDKVKQGGTDVNSGIPKNPDRLYRVGDPNDKKNPVTFPFEVTQEIKVSGCPVRTNTITYTKDKVVMTP